MRFIGIADAGPPLLRSPSQAAAKLIPASNPGPAHPSDTVRARSATDVKSMKPVIKVGDEMLRDQT